MTPRIGRALDGVTRVRGVQGAMLVSLDDGLVVADALMEGVRGSAMAALAASLANRLSLASSSSGTGAPQFLHLQADHGVLLAVPGPEVTLLVCVGGADVNIGLARLEMLRAVEKMG